MPKDTAPVIDDSKTTEEVLETIVVPAPVPSLVRKDGGVYLTDQQLLEAEIQRATLEKREPDFSYFYGEEFLQDAPGSVVEDEEPPDFSYFYGEEFLQDAPGSVVEDEEPNA